MLRSIAAGGAALAVLALAACGHQAGTGASQDGATLGAYVLDATPADAPSPDPAGQPAAPQPAAPRPAASPCSRGQDAYKVLVFLVSSDTGMSVRTIAGDLRSGQTLADVAGSRTGQVEQQAIGLVQAWLQFAEANGRLTAGEAARYRAAAVVVIDGLMTANVAACVPAMN